MGTLVVGKYKRLFAASLVALLCAVFFYINQGMSADTPWKSARFTYPDLQPRNIVAPPSGFIFRGVEIHASCLINPENFKNLFQHLVGQGVVDADIVKMMARMRQFLKTQGFRDVKTIYEASQVRNGIAPISVNASLPENKMAQAHQQCAPQHIQMTGRDHNVTTTIKKARLEGMEEVDPAPFQAQLDNMIGRQFNAGKIVQLMQEIRKAYRNTSQPLPRVAFDSSRAKQGVIALTVHEEHYFTPPRTEEPQTDEIDPADVPVKVARERPRETPMAQKPRPQTAKSQTAAPQAVEPQTAEPQRFTYQTLELLDTPAMRKAAKQANKGVATAKQAPKRATKPTKEPEQKPKDTLKEKLKEKPAEKAPEKLSSQDIAPSDAQVSAPKPVSEKTPQNKPENKPGPPQQPSPAPLVDADPSTLAGENIVLADAPKINFEDIQTPEDITYKERPEEQLLILQTFVEDIQREDAILGFRDDTNKQTLLSLSGVADTLGIPIDVRPELGAAAGWVRKPDEKFKLVYPFDKAHLGPETLTPKKGAVELHFDDIYVAAKLLEDVFEIDMDINTATLQLFIKPDEPLPFQERMARRERWQKIEARKNKAKRPEAPRQDIPYAMAAKPTIRIDNSSSFNKSGGETTANHSTSIVTRGDLLGFSAQSNTTFQKQDGENVQLDNFEVLLTRRDETNSMLGPLKASSIQLGDVNINTVPLLDANRRGRGVEISNEPMNFVRDPDNFVVEGFLPPGWDVEIFQDERLLDFQTVDNSGRYEFETLSLRTGLNIFRIIAHGPNGERREEERRFFLGPNMVKEGEFIYQLSALESTEPLFGIGNNADITNLGSALQGSFNYGVNRNLSLTGALFDGSIDTLDTQAATGGIRASFFETFLQLDAMAEKEGGKIYSASARRNITDTLQLLASGQTSEGFSSDIRSDKSNWFVRLSNSVQLGNLHPVGFSLGYRKETFNNGPNSLVTIENRINTFIKKFNISNELDLEKRDGTDDRLIGELNIRRRVSSGGFWRGELTYARNQEGFELRTGSVRGQFDFGEGMTYVGELNKDFFGDKEIRFSNRLSWEWEGFRWGVSNQIRDNGDYRVGLNVGTTLSPEQDGYQKNSRPSASGEGTVLARVFVDENEDKIYQHGEPLLEGVDVVNRRGNRPYKTAANGMASIQRMPVFSPNRMSIDGTTLPDFYLQPADEVVSVVARPGIIGSVNMPVYRLGEIAGTVRLKQNGDSEILEGAPIVLRNQKGEALTDLQSEYDGFFVFPALRMGTYTLTIPQSYLADYGLDAPLVQEVTLKAKQSIVDDVTLEITPEPQTN